MHINPHNRRLGMHSKKYISMYQFKQESFFLVVIEILCSSPINKIFRKNKGKE